LILSIKTQNFVKNGKMLFTFSKIAYIILNKLKKYNGNKQKSL